MSVVDQIRDACESFDRVLAKQLADGLAKEIRASGGAYPSDLALKALKPLRRKRYFDIALDLAEAVFESGQQNSSARIFYAQALIDSGRVAAAIPYLESFIASAPPDEARIEAQGLLGRAYKQLYVNGGGDPALRRDYLTRACRAYYDVYSANNDEAWHGINAVALFRQAKDLPLPDPREIAQQILDDMRSRIELEKMSDWDYATAGEAALALGDFAGAAKWYEEYVKSGADAFEISSTLRQLIEVWKYNATDSPGREILPLLRAALLKREGGEVKVSPQAVRAHLESTSVDGLEKSFGVYGAESLGWFELGLDRCRGVCRIEFADESPVGTGFVVRGGDFHETLGDELLVLTNHHVVNEDVPGALRARDAQARFEAVQSGKTYRFHPELVWSSRSFDATLLRFAKTPPKLEPFPLAEDRPTRKQDQPPPLPRVFLIGHPLGGGLSLSLVNNELVASDETRLHYRAPTEKGSSGSPVFNDKWFVVGLHHRGDDQIENLYGGPPYAANEAYWIGAVREKCAQELVTPPLPKSSRPSTRARKSSRR